MVEDIAETNIIIQVVEALTGLLLVATIVLAFCKKYNLPFTVALVVVGAGLSELASSLPQNFATLLGYQISPEVILYVCLPTLIFESASKIEWNYLKEDLLPILTFAIPGLLLSTILIAIIVWLFSSLSFPAALLLGSILSATDPVAVISIFKQLGAPKRLSTLVEGESLFNDATALVTSQIIFVSIAAGLFTFEQIPDGILFFLKEFLGGAFVGWILAIIIGNILGHVESDPYIEASLSILLAYSSFILAQEAFHVSGVMATLVAGLTMSSWGQTKISPSVSEFIHHFWDQLSYVANSMIFLLVGLNVKFFELLDNIWILIVVFIAMLISRAVVVFGLTPLVEGLSAGNPIDFQHKIIIWWGGLRGAIALAIILSLGEFENSDQMILIVMGAVLFTLLIQGLSIKRVVHFLGLDIPFLSDRIVEAEGLLTATQRAKNQIPTLQQGGLFSGRIAEKLKENCNKHIHNLNQQIEEIRETEMSVDEESRILFLQCFATQKASIFKMFAEGHLSGDSYNQLSAMLEPNISNLRHSQPIIPYKELTKTKKFIPEEISKFIGTFPIVQVFMERMRSKGLAKDYELFWGLHQGVIYVLNHLTELADSAAIHPEIIDEVSKYFKEWREFTREHLATIAEQFPEFVTIMQERLAERLVLHVELDAIQDQVTRGAIPQSVAESMKTKIERRMIVLRERVAVRIELDPTELLKKVPILEGIAPQDFKKILALLKSHIYLQNDYIINEGEQGNSLYLIDRGVVRISRKEEGGEKDLATLMAGDFFGEIALLHEVKRTASCRAVTPCSVYELSRDDFNYIIKTYPGIKAAVERADAKRQEES